MVDLKALRERVLAASEADLEIDWLIAQALRPDIFANAQRIERETQEAIDAAGLTAARIGRAHREALYSIPRYTAVTDVVFSLINEILPGWAPSVGQNVHHGHWFAYIQMVEETNQDIIDFHGRAPTPALALLSALLSALVSKQGGEDEVSTND